MARKHKNKFRKLERSGSVPAKSETYSKTVSIVPDGNCLFRALSYGMYNTQEHHKKIREEVVREVTNNWETYQNYIIGDTAYGSSIVCVSDYEACMGLLGKFGGHQELQAFVSVHTQVYIEIYNLSNEVLASYGNLLTCQAKFSLVFTGNNDRGHYDFLKPGEILEVDSDHDEDDYDYTFEIPNQKGSKKNRW